MGKRINMAWEKEKKPAFNRARLLPKYCKNFNQTGNVQSDNGIFVSQNAIHECKNVLLQFPLWQDLLFQETLSIWSGDFCLIP